jgi:cystine transport system substrate-binding protein
VTSRSEVRAFAGGIGIVAGLVSCAIVAAGLIVALGLPSESRADDPPPTTTLAPEPRPTELVVALGLGDPVLQAGVVRDGEVIIARGLEVDVARNLAKRLGIPHVRFVYVKPASRLLVATVRPWDLTIASIRPARAASASADLSDPYLGTDQAVVLRRGLPRVSALADLRKKTTCAVRASEGAQAIAGSVRPLKKPILPVTETRLLQLIQTGVCDAALVDANSVGQFAAGRGGILGPVSVKVERPGGYVIAVTRGGPITVSEVDRALARMRADGTMHRLARQWLEIDPARLRPLR